MPSPQEKHETSREYTLSFHCIAHLDLLGQRQFLRQLESLPETPAEQRRINDALKKTAGTVLSVRRAFRESLKQMDSLNEFIGNFPEDKRELAKRMVERKVSLRAFSDSFIATASLHNDNEHCKAMNGVFSVMVATAGMVATGFGCGVPIRGGIEIGLGLDIEDDEIYGPAIARAYDLESMVADYPRVLLGPELIGFLDEVRNQTPTSAFGNFAKGVAARCMSLVTRDTDGLAMLDFLGHGMQTIAREAVTGLVKPGFEFVVAEQERWTNLGDLKLAARYGRLRSYYESRLSIWQTDTTSPTR